KMGERTLRRLLIIGASSVVRKALRQGIAAESWLGRMLARKPRMLVIVRSRTRWLVSRGPCRLKEEFTGLQPWRRDAPTAGGVGGVGRSEGEYGAQSARDGIG